MKPIYMFLASLALFIAFIAGGFRASDVRAEPTVVQTPSFITGHSATPAPYVFAAAPKVGDLLLLEIGWNGLSTTTVTPPAGFTKVTANAVRTGNNTCWYYRFATATDVATHSYTFSWSASSFIVIGGLEVHNANTVNPIDTLISNNKLNSSATVQNTATPIPTVLHDISAAGFTQGNNQNAPTAIGAGWTAYNQLTGQCLNLQTRIATTDIITPIGATATYSTSIGPAQALILVKPGCLGGRMSLMGGGC